jgi:phage-related baseplate assembly protein
MPDPFASLPPISFVNTDVAAVSTAVVQAFQEMWFADTGEMLVLTQADRRYHFLLCLVAYLINERELIDQSAKQNLLPFATGGFLDNLATLYGPRMLRLEASAAQVPLEFSLGSLLNTAALIPAGTLVGSADSSNLVFATNQDLTIPIGQITGKVNATCQTVGPIGNGLLPGTITNLINWAAPFALSVTNLDVSTGGADTESDYAYRRRIYLATQSFSNAGSYGAYEFFALSASPAIAEVSVMGPEFEGIQPGNVLVTVLLQNGEFPNQSILDLVYSSINPDTIRDLCAFVKVQAPIPVPYSIWVDYYIDSSQANQLVQIQSQVNQAVQDWVVAQALNLKGSINPSTLVVAMVNAGASYVMISQPTHQLLTFEQVPSLVNDPVVRYLGTEADLP